MARSPFLHVMFEVVQKTVVMQRRQTPIDMPFAVQHHIPMIQKVQKSHEAPQLQFIDDIKKGRWSQTEIDLMIQEGERYRDEDEHGEDRGQERFGELLRYCAKRVH